MRRLLPLMMPLHPEAVPSPRALPAGGQGHGAKTERAAVGAVPAQLEGADAAQLAYVGLGANLGDAAAAVRQALAELHAWPGVCVLRASALYASAPVQAEGPDFINAVAELSTTLQPLALLAALQAIEQRHGRQRPYPNAPRTLDLDLLLHGSLRLTTPQLTLPHPRMAERAFVLLPLAELAPQLVSPAALAAVAGQRIRRLG